MPTTPAARQLPELPAEVWQHIASYFRLAYHIGRAAPTCKVVSVAARNAIKVRRFSGEVVTLAGHTSAVWCVAAAPDGSVITGSYDETVKVWRDGACVRTFQAHAGSVKAVAVLPGGARFVSVSFDCTAKLWTLDGAEALERTFSVGSRVMCVAALPDGAHFVVGLDYPSRAVRLYHVNGTLVHAFKGHTSTVAAVAVTLNGQHIISGSEDKLVKVWSVATKSLVSTCFGHTDWVLAVAAMPDGQRILSGGDDETVRVWLPNGTLKNTFRLHTSGRSNVKDIVALPDNQHALSGSYDKTVKLFNVNDGAVLRTFTHNTDPVNCLALLPDGRRFVSGSFEKTARIAYHGLEP
jgi:WD40 repeat protein